MLKNKKIWIMVFALCCFIGIGTCLIVNLAINGKITWGMYPLVTIPFGFLILLPLFSRKNRIAITLCAVTVLVFPFLLFLSKITPIKDWFTPLGLPIAIAGLILLWILYFLLRFIKINAWYKASIVIFLCGAIMSPTINYFINKSGIAKGNGLLNTVINIFSCVALSAACGIYGYTKHHKSTKAAVDESSTNGN